MKIKQWITVTISLVLVLLLTSYCSDNQKVRKYKEAGTKTKPATSSPHGSMPPAMTPGKTMPAHGGGHTGHFKWDTPEGWQLDSQPSTMRLATFVVKSGDQSAKCTIVPLQGDAGGLKANVSRWLGQVSSGSGHMDSMVTSGDESTVEQLLSKQEKFLTKGNFPAVFVDFTPYTEKPADDSILATVITLGASTVFIKLSGPKQVLEENKDKFKSLSKSFSMGTTPEPEKPQTPATGNNDHV